MNFLKKALKNKNKEVKIKKKIFDIITKELEKQIKLKNIKLSKGVYLSKKQYPFFVFYIVEKIYREVIGYGQK